MTTITQTNQSRVQYFPFQLAKNSDDLEANFTLGGADDDISVDDEDDIFSSPEGRIKLTNGLSMVFGGVCIFISWFEGQDMAAQGQHCPVLVLGMVLGATIVLSALIALYGVWMQSAKQVRSARALYAFGYVLNLIALVGIVAVGMATFLHWDYSGNPQHSVLHTAELLGVKHRYLLWSIYAATSLIVLGNMSSVLRLVWPLQDEIFRYTVYFCCLAFLATGSLLVYLGYETYAAASFSTADGSWSVIGSAACGVALGLNACYGAIIQSRKNRILMFMVSLAVTMTALIFFSNMNLTAINVDPSAKRIYFRQSLGLLGLWIQPVTAAALLAASKWNQNVRFK